MLNLKCDLSVTKPREVTLGIRILVCGTMNSPELVQDEKAPYTGSYHNSRLKKKIQETPG
jgi:hypothetical protein